MLALGLLLTACSHSIREKKEEFGKTVNALLEEGFVLEKKEEGAKRSTYLLRLDKSDKVSGFLLRSATGSSDPRLRRELSDVLKGIRLSLEVNWPLYAKAEPGSVTAFLLPKDGNGTGELRRLLQEKKIAADLDFDKEGHLKRVSMRPLDEKIKNKDKRGRIQIKNTVLKITRNGKENYDQAYSFSSALWQLKMQSPRGEHLDMGYRDLQCNVDMQSAYYGRRECGVGALSLDMDMLKGQDREKTGFLIKGMDGKSLVERKNGEVASDGRITIKQIVLKEDTSREKFDFDIADMEIAGKGEKIAEETYRRLVDLLAQPPASEKEAVNKAMSILGEFFKKMALGYRITVAKVKGEMERPVSGKKTDFGLEGLEFGVDWAMADDFNISKLFKLDSFRIRQTLKGKPEFEGKLTGFALGIKIEKLYNFMPELMVLAMEKARHPKVKMDSQTRKALEELGGRVTRKGVTVVIDPFKIDSLQEKDRQQTKSFDAMDLKLQVDLAPNKLDPRNPMAPMLALAYLKAEGKATLKKKDLQQILPLLDPGMRMMATRFVKYEGNRAIFELRFEQGNLLINGKPLQ